MLDETRDHADITALIDRETRAFCTRDYATYAACWVQSPRAAMVSAAPGIGVTVLQGWEAIRADIDRAVAAGITPCRMTDFRQENLRITIQGDMAWSLHDGWMRSEDGGEAESIETRILERTPEGWKIVYLSFAHRHVSWDGGGRLAVDAEGRHLWSDRHAEVLLADHPVFTLSHGRLRAHRRDWDKALQDAIRRAGAMHAFFPHQEFVADTGAPFRAPVVLGEEDDGTVRLCVLTVQDGVTVVELDPTRGLERRLAAAAAIFGLSPGQVALARRLAGGEGLTGAAEGLGITVNTARTHLARIYDKTGVPQTALVRLLLSVG